jgi:uncharacterized protein (TIGR02996 family)
VDEEKSFLANLRDSPGDDMARLVYSDWLEERGDCRGEFLRAAVAARTAGVADADLHQHLHRLGQLRSAVSPGWLLQAYRSLAEDDVREVVFRELLGDGRMFETFLGVENEQDPSPYLFALVARRCSGVQPLSAAELGESGYYGKQSGQHGSLVSIDGLEWVAEDLCRVEGAYFTAPLMAHGNLYEVGVRDSWWAVLEVTNLWIS